MTNCQLYGVNDTPYINENTIKVKIPYDNRKKDHIKCILSKLINKNVIKNKTIINNYYIYTIIIKKKNKIPDIFESN